jgi:integrase
MKRSRKRANHEGTIYRRKSDGLYVAAIKPKGGQRLVGYSKTREGAVEKLELLRHRAKIPMATTEAYTVKSWVDAHILRQEVSDGTRDLWLSALKTHITPHLGHRPLSRLTAVEVADWVTALAANNVGDRIRQVAFDLLRNAMRSAEDMGVIPKNPTRPVKRPRSKRKPLTIFTPEEIGRILHAVADDREEAVYWLAFGAGMRQGEIFGLKWAEVDLKAGQLRIVRQAVERKGGIVIREPKTKQSIRTVSLSQPVVDALIRRKAHAMAESLGACEWVCPSPEGLNWRRTNFARRHWKPLLAKLNLKVRGLHHARHSAATLMLRSGVALHIVSSVVGHSDTSTTADIYGHALPGDQAAATKVLGDQLSVATG